MAAKEIIFYYDVVCPFACVASRLIEDIATRCGAAVRWRPVLLGGIYKYVRPDGSTNSALEHMCEAKRKITSADFKNTMFRHGVYLRQPSVFPISTVSAMRLVASAPNDPPQNLRIKLTHALYAAFWQNDQDVSDHEVLGAVARSVGWEMDVNKAVEEGKEKLHKNTEELAKRGGFGVPSFWVNEELFWGVDSIHFVERSLGRTSAHPPRLATPPALPTPAKLTIYHDFASPWSYIGSKQIESLVKQVSPVNVEVEWVPIVLGALFKRIGTPMVPAFELSPAKSAYMMRNINLWSKYHGISFQQNTSFPLRTILPLRVSIVDRGSKVRDALYTAAWANNKNIGDEKVVIEILKEHGLPGEDIVSLAQTQAIKNQLKDNTERAFQAGLCGVPSYQVNDGPVIWGQDRLNVVADMLCGWNHFTQVNSKL